MNTTAVTPATYAGSDQIDWFGDDFGDDTPGRPLDRLATRRRRGDDHDDDGQGLPFVTRGPR